MTRKSLLALVAAVAMAALAWDLLRETPPAGPSAQALPASGPAAVAGSVASAGSAPLAPAGSAKPLASANFLKVATVRDTQSPLAREMSQAKALRPLYDRLRDSPEGRTPEGQYFLYAMLRACATIADRRGPSGARPLSPTLVQEIKDRTLAQSPEGSALREQRLAALELLSQDKCEGFGGVSVSEAELANLLKSAAQGGDPKARVAQAEREMWQERAASSANRQGWTRPTLNESQIESVRGAFASRDPEAMALAGNLLNMPFRDLTLRLAGDADPVDTGALRNAALLLACEYGYPCGANAPQVMSGCAMQARCGVASLPDYIYYFAASPFESQAIDRYRSVLRQVADSGDLSLIGFSRFTTTTTMTTTTTSSAATKR